MSHSKSKMEKSIDESGGSSGNEVSAEWIVRAQLKITPMKKKKAASFTTGDCGARRSDGSPCRVVYKWESENVGKEKPPTNNPSDFNDEKVRHINLFVDRPPEKHSHLI